MILGEFMRIYEGSGEFKRIQENSGEFSRKTKNLKLEKFRRAKDFRKLKKI